ncbi:MAG TPA: FecR family protein [Candidatus Eisenbacteria bacterium]|nr:FecR family protein [Candidatus Eisenbacteria bacterium]
MRRIAVAALFLLACVPSSAETRLSFQEGEVNVDYPGGPPAAEPASEFSLADGARLETGPGSACEVLIGDGTSTLRLEEKTRASVTRSDPPRVALDLGKIYVRFKGAAGKELEVRTPTAVTSARGTGWGQTPSSIEVFESAVTNRSPAGAEIRIPEGSGLKLLPDGAFGESFALDQALKDRWSRFVEEAASHEKAFEGFLATEPEYERQRTRDYSGYRGPDLTVTLTWWAPVDVDLWVENQDGLGRPQTREAKRGPGLEAYRPWDLSGTGEDVTYYIAAGLADRNVKGRARITISVSIPGRGRQSFSEVLDEEKDRDFWIACSVDVNGTIKPIRKFDSSIDNYLVGLEGR